MFTSTNILFDNFPSSILGKIFKSSFKPTTLIDFSSRRLFIDSFAQHAAKALGKPSTVLWPVNNVKTLGYPDFHHNIVSKAPKRKVHLIDSYFSDAPIDGSNTHENPFDTNFIFDEKAIENSVLHRRL